MSESQSPASIPGENEQHGTRQLAGTVPLFCHRATAAAAARAELCSVMQACPVAHSLAAQADSLHLHMEKHHQHEQFSAAAWEFSNQVFL